MKGKRYFCDWALSPFKRQKSVSILFIFLVISVVVVTAISGLIYYNIMMHNHSVDLETYSESAYEYLDEIANNVIGEDGINIAAIPEDVVEYEITYKDEVGEIIFKYSLDNNKEKEWATSASMTVTLSKDFEVLSKKPNFSSKEEYAKIHKIRFFSDVAIFGIVTWMVIALVSLILIEDLILISKAHKKKDMKRKVS